ncbi:TRAP transporter large permease [Pseudooceanicola sp. C21-150M6]|uniref:TRAP transporter large permease n=1 Tax=Pseudooceanicola sp. C21-150M6 TaxID=3434355 RepID=UPI003D7F40A3
MTVLFGALVLLILLGLPVGVALAGSSLIYLLMSERLPEIVMMQRMVAGVDSFVLLAVPFFVLAGSLMNACGVTDRIFAFAMAGVGWMKGGMGHVNVGASVLFAGMSGAAVADAGGLGAVEIKAMRDRNYDDDFAIGITAASSTIGPIIPPSLPMVIYGVAASASIGQLFVAGILPGLLMAVLLMAVVWVIAHRRGYPADETFHIAKLGRTFLRAGLSLMTPVIIVGGILLGVFTPTESAVAAVAYVLILGVLVYRRLSAAALVRILIETVETSSVLLFIVAASGIFSWILSREGVPTDFAQWVTSISDNPILIILFLNLVLLVVGCFMEPGAAIMILTPVLLPIAADVGIEPVQFGVIMVLNLMIGLLTPPVGLVTFTLARVSGVTMAFAVKATAPFFIALVLALLCVSFIPGLTMWLPSVFYGG